MTGESELTRLLKTMKPKLNIGDYVFCTVETRLLSEAHGSEDTQEISDMQVMSGMQVIPESQVMPETHRRASLRTEINLNDIILMFKEKEGITIILKKEIADHLKLEYSFVAAWITLTVHSSLEAVGLTAAFSKALADEGISCNVVAGYYHDHLFVDKGNANKAMVVLDNLSKIDND